MLCNIIFGYIVDVVITEWALQSYLDLRARSVFSDQEYWNVLRPDVQLLKSGLPSPHPKLQQSNFWGPATRKNGAVIHDGYKMKWHNLGHGKVQLRLCVAMLGDAYLCQAYVKDSAAVDQREMAKLGVRINLIKNGQYQYRGRL